jgi:hypothetical protein
MRRQVQVLAALATTAAAAVVLASVRDAAVDVADALILFVALAALARAAIRLA